MSHHSSSHAPQGDVSEVEASGASTIRRVMPYLWPEGETGIKMRVVVSMLALLVSKLIAVGTPILYKGAVDALAPSPLDAGWLIGIGAVGLTVAYGVARLMSNGFQQLRDSVFAMVGQRALRQLAVSYTHLTLPTSDLV